MSGAEPVVAVLALLACVTVWLLVGRGRTEVPLHRGDVHQRLEGLVAAATRALDEPDRRRAPTLAHKGVLEGGRRVRVAFFGPAGRVRAAVSVRRDAPPLRVRLEGVLDRLRKRLVPEDIVTGDEAFDARFFLQSARPDEGAEALTNDVRRAIKKAFTRFDVDRLELGPGELAVEADADEKCAPDRWQELVELLDETATLIDIRPVHVRALGGERGLVRDEDGRTRCVYCRDGLSGDEDDLVACERCRTALHGACWEEHGGCPVFGCGGRTPERPRLRG
ncbi:MAG: hypothetical protein M9894_35975 [Planctomycetes bacterium]|nr:hypothetical protein [Planctomycetota bacterium]